MQVSAGLKVPLAVLFVAIVLSGCGGRKPGDVALLQPWRAEMPARESEVMLERNRMAFPAGNSLSLAGAGPTSAKLWVPVSLGVDLLWPVVDYWKGPFYGPELSYSYRFNHFWDVEVAIGCYEMWREEKRYGTRTLAVPISITGEYSDLFGLGFYHVGLGASWFAIDEKGVGDALGLRAVAGYSFRLAEGLLGVFEVKAHWAYADSDFDMSAYGFGVACTCNF